jgi:PAS domain-containing protein
VERIVSAMRILVVDRDPAVAEGLRQAFAERGLPVELEVAEGAADALRRLRQPAAAGPGPGAAGRYAVLLADPGDWPGRLAQAVAEVRAASPRTALLALLEPRGRLDREAAVLAGFDDAFLKHPRAYPVLAPLAAELAERRALTRQQLRLSQARGDAEQLLTALMTATDAAVAVLDGEGAVTVANGRFCRLAGRPLAEMLGRPLWPRLATASATSLRAALATPDAATGALPLPVLIADGSGGEAAADARVAVRELGNGQRSAVLVLRPASEAGPGPAGAPAPPPPAPARLVEPVVDPSTEGLRAALRGRVNPVVVARVRLAESVRALARTGTLPPEIAAVMQQALRDALAGLLGDGDVVFAHADEAHLLLADEGVLAATRRLARAIPAARDALLRSPRLAHDLLAVGGARLAEQLGELSELQVTSAPIDLAPDELGQEELPALLATRLLVEEATLGAETLRALNELRATAACELRMVQDQDGAPSALCLPCLDPAAASRMEALEDLAETRAEVALQTALLGLELAAEALGREVDRESALAVVDLRFAVLGQRRLADRFLDRCRTLPPGTTRSLVVNLLGVPPGAYAPKFARVTAGLAEIFRLRALTLRDVRADLVDLDLGRIGLLVIDYRELEPHLEERQDLVQALVRKAHRSQARLLVRRVPRGVAAGLRERLGVDLTSAA